MKSKSKIAVILTVVILTITMLMQTVQTNAQDITYVTNYLYVTAAPNPVGVGQTVYISLFFTKPLPPAYGMMFGEGFYTDLSVNVVPPTGSNTTFSDLTTDSTGGVGGLEFVPDEVGEYQVQAFYPGEPLAGAEDSIYLKATASPVATFVVQEEQIPTFSTPPLPTEYWSRPIYATNYAWAALGGNWWGLGRPAFMNTGGYDASGNNFNAYTEAPNTGHIMWTKPIAFGGQVGLPISADQESHYTSTSILYKQFEPIILNGIVYFDYYPNTPDTRAGRMAIDIRTGETLWTQEYNDDTLAFGQVLKFHTIQEYGSQAWLWAMGQDETGSYMYKLYDPMTGTFVANVTNLPSSLVGMFGGSPAGLMDFSQDLTKGSVLIHWIDGGSLTMWNSTLMMIPDPNAFGASTIRPSGNIDFQLGIQWSVPIPTTYNDDPISPSLGISAKTDEAILVTSYPAIIPTFATEFGDDYAIDAAFDTKTGELLWGPVKRNLVLFNEINVVAAGEGYYVRHDKDTNQAYGYSLLDGDVLWTKVQLEGNPLGTLARGAAIAYGNVYIWDFGGDVYAIDLESGEVEWTFTRGTAGYENPYGIYPIWHFGSHSIADGKLFLSEGRMYDPPMFPNARKLAINCTTGELVWSVLGFYARNTGVIADGYLLGYNSYDCQIYTMGKGQTDTSAIIEEDVVVDGAAVLVKGMVTDESPGTKDSDRIARFPDGVPAVCDDNMSAWMEYVYMQQPKPTDAIGVEVTVSVLDPNGNTYDVATATTDLNGFYSATFTPPVPGKYTVYVTYAGSESYWPSSAVSAIHVEEVPEPTAAPTASPAPMTDAYVLGIGAGSIIAIVAIGLVIILMLRKR
jgi:outer membrane protein assembly factor BamB